MNATSTPSMTMVHTRANIIIQPVVMEDDVSTCETTMLLVETEVTVVATELAFRYELKLVKRPGEVMDIAASCADIVVGIMTSAS